MIITTIIIFVGVISVVGFVLWVIKPRFVLCKDTECSDSECIFYSNKQPEPSSQSTKEVELDAYPETIKERNYHD